MFNRILLFLIGFRLATCEIGYNWITPDHSKVDVYKMTERLLKSAAFIIRDTDEQIERAVYRFKLNSIRSIPFEVGYITYNIQEEYRRMVDKYNTSIQMESRLYYHELMMYLEDIEYHFWHIEHLNNMLHEVERKYGMKGDTMKGNYKDYVEEINKYDKARRPTPSTTPSFLHEFNRMTYTKKKRLSKFKVREEELVAAKTSTSKPRLNKWWKFDYGWEIETPW